MAASVSDSDLAEKSWHLLSLLLRIGHPLDIHHLCSQCTLFAASPDFVRHVASLPDSPISVSADNSGLVAPSAAAVYALGRFFSVAVDRRRFVTEPGFSRGAPGGSGLGKRRVAAAMDVAELLPAPKRRLFFSSAEGGRDQKSLAIGDRVPEISLESYADAAKAMMRGNFPSMKFESQYTHCENSMIPLRIDTNGECSDCPAPNVELRAADNDAVTSVFRGEIPGPVIEASNSLFMTGNDLTFQEVAGTDRLMQSNTSVVLALPNHFQDTLLCNDLVDSIGFENKMDHFDTFTHEYPEQNCIHPADDICISDTCKDPIRESKNENEYLQVGSGSKKGMNGSGTEQEKENVSQKGNHALCVEELKNGVEPKSHMPSLNLDKEVTVKNMETFSTPKQLLKSSCILKGGQKNDLHPKSQYFMESIACNTSDNSPKNVDKCKNDQKLIVRNKLKQGRKENIAETISMTPKVERKAYPSFDNFTIEEEEGSGGYGTVYRARRKTDGKRFAIKCPHNNAHKNHINNEWSMLERFGGKNCIIKFEGTYKSGNSDCFVLEHVEHDRPDILKKEIDIPQLQWYGYCLFKALACLHKEGVVHRDVKPGNFLFSRKLSKGYLIDFNLAMDLKKYNTGSKSRPGLDTSNNNPLPSGSGPLIHDKNLGGSKSLTSNKRELADYKKNSELNRHVKQKAYAGPLKNCPDKAGGSLLRAQGTDGSGITSAKDVTSTRTRSVERLREPIPSQGRKELISLVQSSLQSERNSSIKGPSSQRKRVTAPSGKADGKIAYPTPMPLHSYTGAAGLLRSKGDGKPKREGACVGTKGFRAPEVLLRSQFQGSKVDIWSAGVTLLYMMIGKTPFTGDPEQNIKDIAKLRGSEELWEIAKLHDRELSFPAELLHERYLESWDMENWCKLHTKRPEFLQHIPKSLYDLIDKCLTVNPRNRISIEDVLRHEFFASCQENQRKHRMIRRSLSSEIAPLSST